MTTGIDAGQLRALLRLQLLQAFRPGTDPTTGARTNPLVGLVFGIGFFGVITALNASRCADAATFRVLVFGNVMLLVALNIGPDAHDVSQRNRDVLGVRPISARTLAAARTLELLAFTSIVGGVMGLAPMIALHVELAVSWWSVLLTYATLLAGCFTLVALWLHLVLLALRWITVETVRTLNTAGVAIGMVGLLLVSVSLRLAGMPLHIESTARSAVQLLPPTWFANVWMEGSLLVWAQRAGIVLLIVLALAACSSSVHDETSARLAEQSVEPVARPGRAPPAAWFLRRVAAPLRSAGWASLSQSLYVAAALVTMLKRDPHVRQRTVGTVLLLLLLLAGLVLGAPSAELEPLAGVLLVLCASDGASLVIHSGTPAAAWAFFLAPMDARAMVRTTQITVAAAFLPAALLTLTWVATRAHGALLGITVVLAHVVMARLVVAVALAFQGAMPCSREARVSIVENFVRGMPIALLSPVLVAAVHVAGTAGDVIGIVAACAVAVLLAVALVVCIACERRAASKLARAEHGF